MDDGDWCSCDEAEEIPSDEPFKKYKCNDCGAKFYFIVLSMI